MKRSVFLIIAGILPILFGLTMIFNGNQMLGIVSIETNLSTRVVLQWMGCPLMALGVMNLLARNDAGSPALRALMIGNILVHVFGAAVDAYDFAKGYINAQGIGMGSVVHGILILGFGYYLAKLPKTA